MTPDNTNVCKDTASFPLQPNVSKCQQIVGGAASNKLPKLATDHLDLGTARKIRTIYKSFYGEN